MANALILLAEGFEEIEAVTVADLLRRGEVEVTIAAVSGKRNVTGSHGITLHADQKLSESLEASYDLIFLPGGMPGSLNLLESEDVRDLVQAQLQAKRWVAAICAAPMVLGAFGLLKGRRATCYPGFEDKLKGAEISHASIVEDGFILTSRGPGTAMEFGIALVEKLRGASKARDVQAKALVG